MELDNGGGGLSLRSPARSEIDTRAASCVDRGKEGVVGDQQRFYRGLMVAQRQQIP